MMLHDLTALDRFIPMALAAVVTIVALRGERMLLGDERSLFAHALENASADARARVAAAINRRRAFEQTQNVATWIGVASMLLVGAASLLKLIDAGVGVALTMIVYVLTAVMQMLSIQRVGSGRRVASLVARSATSLVPPWLFAVPLLSSAAGLAIASRYGTWAATVLATIASLLACTAIPILAKSPAIIGDGDRVVDEVVDEKVRASRVRQMLLIAAYAPLLVLFVSDGVGSDERLTGIRTLWTLSLTGLILWSNQRLRFSDVDLRRIYGLSESGS